MHIKYTQFDQHFTPEVLSDPPHVYLIYGESYLVRQIQKKLCKKILGDAGDSFSIENLDGGTAPMGDIIEHISTLSFLVPQKMVIVNRAPLFQTGTKSGDVSYSSQEITHLADLISNGIADTHYLVLTTNSIDRRKKIYKTFSEYGCTIDCSVAQGSRKADLDEQQKVLLDVVTRMLGKANKTISRPTFGKLSELTGFNIDLLVRNIEKLIAYTGHRPTIEIEDLKAVVKRDKKDPIFNFTNAFMDKNIRLSIFYLTSLLNEGYHPLQILKSIENQTRKLLLVKAFIHTAYSEGQVRFKSMNYKAFQQTIMPKVIAYDTETKAAVENDDTGRNSQTKSGKKQSPADLLLAPNPKNAYPVFQIFQKSDKFSIRELQSLLIYLSDLDFRLKSSSFDINTIIEQMLMKICSNGGFAYAAENKNRRHRF